MSDEPKKITLAEAMKQKLAQKKQAQSSANQQQKKPGSAPVLKSQQTKKVNNQSRRTGV